jgi:hypothetical protein
VVDQKTNGNPPLEILHFQPPHTCSSTRQQIHVLRFHLSDQYQR